MVDQEDFKEETVSAGNDEFINRAPRRGGLGLLVFVSAVLIGVGVGVYSFKILTTKEKVLRTQLSGVEISERASKYFKDSVSDTAIPGINFLCATDGNCVEKPSKGPIIPIHIWRSLAFASLYKSTNKATYKDRYIQELVAIKSIIDKANSPMESMVLGYGLFQLEEGYRAFGDLRVLNLITQGADDLLYRAEYEFDKNHRNGIKVPMISSVLARQLALFARLMNEPQVREYLESNLDLFYYNELKAGELPEFRRKLLIHAERILELSERALSTSRIAVGELPSFRENSCWVLQGYLELFNATGDAGWLKRVEEPFKFAKISSRPREELHFLAAGEANPCIDVLDVLCARDSAYCDDRDRLIKDFVLPTWDASIAKRCNGDDAFLSFYKDTSDDWCGGNGKSTSDNAYIVYLLSKRKEVFDVF